MLNGAGRTPTRISETARLVIRRLTIVLERLENMVVCGQKRCCIYSTLKLSSLSYNFQPPLLLFYK